MPIYEFYCRDCHVVFNFFARSMTTTKVPACPRCERPELERRLSSFAISKGRKGPEAAAGPVDDPDGPPLDSLMEELGREIEGADANDPRQMARLMRRLYEKTGMPMDEKADEAMRRMESGEDPDRIDEELGDAFDGLEAPGEATHGASKSARGWVRRLRPPEVDETLYDL